MFFVINITSKPCSHASFCHDVYTVHTVVCQKAPVKLMPEMSIVKKKIKHEALPGVVAEDVRQLVC